MVANLKKRKERVKYVYSGDQAVRIVHQALKRLCDNEYRLILLDCNLAHGLSSFDTAAKIRNLYKQYRVPAALQARIVGLSISMDKSLEEKAHRSGMHLVMSKQISLITFHE